MTVKPYRIKLKNLLSRRRSNPEITKNIAFSLFWTMAALPFRLLANRALYSLYHKAYRSIYCCHKFGGVGQMTRPRFLIHIVCVKVSNFAIFRNIDLQELYCLNLSRYSIFRLGNAKKSKWLKQTRKWPNIFIS